MGREFELKYHAEPSQLEAIHQSHPGLSPITMATTYYDTPDAALRSLRWTLRQRMENGISVCTLKVPLSDGSKGEWEVCCTDILESIPLLLEAGAPKELNRRIAGGIAPICAARFTRLAGKLTFRQSTLELALDQGELLGGERSLPFAEVEVELKEGCDEDAVLFAHELAQTFGLYPEPKSKFRRALDLANA